MKLDTGGKLKAIPALWPTWVRKRYTCETTYFFKWIFLWGAANFTDAYQLIFKEKNTVDIYWHTISITISIVTAHSIRTTRKELPLVKECPAQNHLSRCPVREYGSIFVSTRLAWPPKRRIQLNLSFLWRKCQMSECESTDWWRQMLRW